MRTVDFIFKLAEKLSLHLSLSLKGEVQQEVQGSLQFQPCGPNALLCLQEMSIPATSSRQNLQRLLIKCISVSTVES